MRNMVASNNAFEPAPEYLHKNIHYLVIVIMILGASLRVFRLETQKLWFDELITAEIASSGIETLGFFDGKTVLSKLPFWVAGKIAGNSALSLRAVSLVSSLIALLLFYSYSTMILETIPALLVTWLFAISPFAIYYAQEARLYALGLLGALLTLLAFERLRRGGTWADWALYAIFVCIASHLFLFNVVLAGGQLLALLILEHDRRRVLFGGILTVTLILATLWPFLSPPGVSTITESWWKASASVNLWSTLQTIVTIDARIAPSYARNAALFVVLTGFLLALANYRAWEALLPHLLQITLAILFSFIILPVIGRPAPAHYERAFLVVLPSILIVLGIGMQLLIIKWPGRLVAAVLVTTLTITSFASLSNYFRDFVKSPQAMLAEKIGQNARPGDCAIATHYSIDTALIYYQNSLPVYRYLGEESGNFYVLPNPSNLQVNLKNIEKDKTLFSELSHCKRFWLGYYINKPKSLASLLSQYKVKMEFSVGPFSAQLLKP